VDAHPPLPSPALPFINHYSIHTDYYYSIGDPVDHFLHGVLVPVRVHFYATACLHCDDVDLRREEEGVDYQED